MCKEKTMAMPPVRAGARLKIDEKLTIKDRKAAVMAESERHFHDPL